MFLPINNNPVNNAPQIYPMNTQMTPPPCCNYGGLPQPDQSPLGVLERVTQAFTQIIDRLLTMVTSLVERLTGTQMPLTTAQPNSMTSMTATGEQSESKGIFDYVKDFGSSIYETAKDVLSSGVVDWFGGGISKGVKFIKSIF